MNFDYLFGLLASAAAVIIGIVVHESAHALAAYLLGDRTARSQGRISLNPLRHIDPFGTILLPLIMILAGGPVFALRHIDPFGTILLPLIMILAGGPVFAFAKPVPIYLGNLKHPKRDEVIVSLAGPLSNIALAVLGALLLRGLANDPALFAGGLAQYGLAAQVAPHLVRFSLTLMSVNLSLAFFNLIPGLANDPALFAGGLAQYGLAAQVAPHLVRFSLTLMSVNLSLAFFNLIPLPPLDGSSLLVPFLKGRALQTYYEVQRYSMPILIVVLYVLPSLLHIDLIGLYFSITVDPLYLNLVSLTYYEVQRYSMPILIVVLYVLPSLLHIDLIGLYFSITVDPLYLNLVSFALGF